MYGLLSRIFGPLPDLFYRRTRQGLEIPETGPLLIVANHPNGLVDPMLILRDAGRRVRFLAKEPLFRMPIIGILLKSLGALPVYRPRDGHSTDKNEETFQAVFGALAQGDAVAIFPEGTSHSDPSLKPLKTGAARMALGAEAKHDYALGVSVLPVGLLYRNKISFRSEAITVVGRPIVVSSLRALHEESPKEATAQLTTLIDEGLREVTVNLDRWEDQPLLEMAARIWRPDSPQPLDQLGLIAEADRSFRESEPERMGRLRARVLELGRSLAKLGLTVEQLDARYRVENIARFLLKNLIAVCLGLPIAVVGALAYLVPYQGVRAVVQLARPEQDLVATYKVLLSLPTYLLWQTGLALTASWALGGWWGFWLSAALPFCGLYTLQFIAHRRAAGRELLAFFRLPAIAQRKVTLIRERDAIRRELDELALVYAARRDGQNSRSTS